MQSNCQNYVLILELDIANIFVSRYLAIQMIVMVNMNEFRIEFRIGSTHIVCQYNHGKYIIVFYYTILALLLAHVCRECHCN